MTDIRLLYDPIGTVPVAELEPLADDIRALNPAYRVEVIPVAQRGPGPEVEVLQVFLGTVADAAQIIAILAPAVVWMKQRMAKGRPRAGSGQERQGTPSTGSQEPTQEEQPLLKYVMIFGPDGQVLKSVRVTDPDREPEDITSEDPR